MRLPIRAGHRLTILFQMLFLTFSAGELVAETNSRSQADCGIWQDPEARDLSPRPIGLVKMNQAEVAFGPACLDCHKPFAIFVHGRANQYLPTLAPFDEHWSEQYQTFEFFWSDIAQGSAPVVYTNNTLKAERRLQQALNSLARHLQAHGQKSMQIHLIGHSFGAKISSKVAFKLSRLWRPRSQATSPSPKKQPRQGSAADLGGPISVGIGDGSFFEPIDIQIERLTLLDPALFLDSLDAIEICRWQFQAVDDRNQAIPTVFSEQAMMLRAALGTLQSAGVKIETYATNVAVIFSKRLANYGPVLDLTQKGDGLLGFLEEIFGCMISQFGRDTDEVHFRVVDEYFSSLSESLLYTDPQYGPVEPVISASLPTEHIPRRNYYRVVSSNPNRPWERQRFKLAAAPKPSTAFVKIRSCQQSVSWDHCVNQLVIGREIQF